MDKLYKNGLVIGRFSPIHIGHNKLINSSINLCSRTLVLVGSAQEANTLRNPFDIKTRIKLISKCYPKYDENVLMIRGINDLKNELNNDFSWGDFVISEVNRHLNGDFSDLVIYGNDPVKRTWFDPSCIPNTSELFIPRTDISATYVRGLMVIGDKDNWKKLTSPFIHSDYDRLREKLLSVPAYTRIYKSLKKECTIDDFLVIYNQLAKEDFLKKQKALK